jgi:DNA-binding beta-propeller fold protein YncE
MIALLARCGERSPVHPADDGVTPVVAPYTYVVTDDGDLSLLDRDGTTFIVRNTGDAPPFWAGTAIVGTDRGGFVRRIRTARKENSILFFETEPASLTDVVISGEIDTTIHVGTGSFEAVLATARSPAHREAKEGETVILSSGAALSHDGLRLSGVTLLDNDAGERRSCITITDGFISFNPLVETSVTVRRRTIECVHASAGGILRFSCDLSIDIPEAVDASGEVPLASFSSTFVQYIGIVPVVETVTLTFSAGFEASGEYAGDCDVHGEAEVYSTVEALYRNGSWSDAGSVETFIDSSPLTCREFAETDIRIYVKSGIEISFYAEPAAEVDVVSHFRVAAETPAAPVWEWFIEGGVRGSVAFHAPILDGDLPPHDSVPVDYVKTLESGPFSTDAYAFVTAWGREGTGDGEFLFPRGIAADEAKNIYVVDTNAHRVQVFKPDSTFITSWGGPGSAGGRFDFPNRIAADENGNLYVVDAGNHRVQKFLPDGTFLTEWGSEGTGEGDFKVPQGIAVRDGHVYVTDCFTHRIQSFTTDGTFVSAWGRHGGGTGELNCPMGIAVDGGGTVYVSECHNHRVQGFTAGGNPLFTWGSYGDGDGEFNCPIDVAVDSEGNIHVVDYGNDRIQKFTPDGTLITKLGSTGRGDGEFNQPEGIAVDVDGQLYIVDSENKRVQRFAPKVR